MIDFGHAPLIFRGYGVRKVRGVAVSCKSWDPPNAVGKPEIWSPGWLLLELLGRKLSNDSNKSVSQFQRIDGENLFHRNVP